MFFAIISKTIFPVLSKIFTKLNLNKFVIIFTIGFVSRTLVNYLYGVNVYSDYMNIVSIVYYINMSIFIVAVHEVINYFEIDIIVSPIIKSYIYIKKGIFIINENIFSLDIRKIRDFKLSNLRSFIRLLKDCLGGNKITISTDINESSNTISSNNVDNNLTDTNVILKNSKGFSSTDKGKGIDRSYASNSGSHTHNNSSTRERERVRDIRHSRNNENLRESYNKYDNLPFVVETINDGIERPLATPALPQIKPNRLEIPKPRPAPIAIPSYVNDYSPVPSSIDYNTNYTSNRSRFRSNIPVVNHINYLPVDNNTNYLPSLTNAVYNPNVNNVPYSTSNNNVSHSSNNQNINYSPIPVMPKAPVMSNLTTPSTMTPLFPSYNPSYASVTNSLNNKDYNVTNVRSSSIYSRTTSLRSNLSYAEHVNNNNYSNIPTPTTDIARAYYLEGYVSNTNVNYSLPKSNNTYTDYSVPTTVPYNSPEPSTSVQTNRTNHATVGSINSNPEFIN